MVEVNKVSNRLFQLNTLPNPLKTQAVERFSAIRTYPNVIFQIKTETRSRFSFETDLFFSMRVFSEPKPYSLRGCFSGSSVVRLVFFKKHNLKVLKKIGWPVYVRTFWPQVIVQLGPKAFSQFFASDLDKQTRSSQLESVVNVGGLSPFKTTFQYQTH